MEHESLDAASFEKNSWFAREKHDGGFLSMNVEHFLHPWHWVFGLSSCRIFPLPLRSTVSCVLKLFCGRGCGCGA